MQCTSCYDRRLRKWRAGLARPENRWQSQSKIPDCAAWVRARGLSTTCATVAGKCWPAPYLQLQRSIDSFPLPDYQSTRSGLPINTLRITNQCAQDYQSTRSGLPINALRITNQRAQDYQSTRSGLPINTLRITNQHSQDYQSTRSGITL